MPRDGPTASVDSGILRLARLAAAIVVVLCGLLLVARPAPAQSGGASISGTMRDKDGKPLAGVRFTVSQQGRTIGHATTGADGSWTIPVPAAGVYQVTIDVASLPKGQALRDPSRRTLTDVLVRESQAKIVLFPLHVGGERGASRLDTLVNLAADGLKLGAVVALASVGLSMIFGVTGLVNFAHGELVTFGAMVAFFFNASGAGPHWPLVAGALLAVLFGGGLGWGLEKGLWGPLRARRTGNVSLLVVSIGLSLLLRHVMLIFFGGAPRPFAQYAVQKALALGPLLIVPKDIVVIVLSLVVLVMVGVLLQRTKLGTAMRAVADDKDLAESSGIDVNRVILATWVGGAALAALGGVLYALDQSVFWDSGFKLLLTMFAAVILGGLGTAYGAMAGGLVLGVTSEMSTYWIPVEFKVVVALAIMIVVLLVRPQGILGIRERIG